MHTVLKILATSTLLTLGTAAHASTYQIDKAGQHAFITFKASHLGYSYFIGHFEDFDGEFQYDENAPQASKVNVVIQAKSLDSNHAERDKHLTGEEYFDAEQHPLITFSSTGYEGAANAGQLNGELTIKGITRAVTLNVSKIGQGDDPWGGYRAGFEGNVTLSAGDYDLPGWIGDVEVNLIVEGVRQND